MVFLFILAISITFGITFGPLVGISAFLTLIMLAAWYISPKTEKSPKPVTPPVTEEHINKMAGMKIPYRSEEVIGTYKDNPIHKFVLVQHPDKPDTYLRFDFEGTISFDRNGKFSRPPAQDEAYTKTELIYKNTNVEMTIQK